MARPTVRRSGKVSDLRESLALEALKFAGHWSLPAALERARSFADDARAGRSLVLDAPTLHRAMLTAGEATRAREFRHDRADPAEARRWLLTEDDDLIGPLTEQQLAHVATELT